MCHFLSDGFNIRISSASNSSKHCSTHGWSFFDFKDIYFEVHYVCNDFLPQWALCSTAADFGAFNLDSKFSCYFKGIAKSKCNTFQNGLCHICSCGIHGHSEEYASCIRVVMRRSFSHEVWKEEYLILAKLLDRCLFCHEILRLEDLLRPPFVTGSSA